MNRTTWSVGLALTLVMAGAGRAEAQSGTYFGFLTGQVGVTSGSDTPGAAVTPAVSVSVQDSTGWGAELDLGFAHMPASSGPGLDLTSYMVNLNWMAQSGLVRPYGLGGAGVIQVHGCFAGCRAPATVFDFGLNVGGGALYPVNDAVALRGDVRYFWSPGEKSGDIRPNNYGFWRATVGVTFVWAMVP